VFQDLTITLPEPVVIPAVARRRKSGISTEVVRFAL